MVYLLSNDIHNSVFGKIAIGRWETARVTHIRKDVNNLRPVSLLPLPGKLLEKIIHAQTYQYLEDNNILNSNQGGFRPGHSTISTVARLADIITQNTDMNQATIVSYVDLSNAFDTINHNIFLKKIKCLGFHPETVSWFENYLCGRSQAVTVNNCTSKSKPITCGVPQGSIIGPLAFLIYINDVTRVFQNCEALLYADDTVLISSHTNFLIAISNLQNDLNSMVKWCDSNKLSVNYKKTKVMKFGAKNLLKKLDQPSIFINNFKLDIVDHYKYLGITMDQRLTFDLHLNNAISKMSEKGYLLRKIRPYLDVKTSLMIYKAMVLPYAEYGDIFYGHASAKKRKKIQKLQNENLRLCLCLDPRSNVLETHRLGNINYLEDRRNAHLLNLMYKRSRDENYRDNRLLPIRRFDGPSIVVPNYKKTSSQLNVDYRGATNWNQLPIELRVIQTYDQFKSKQKSLLQDMLI